MGENGKSDYYNYCSNIRDSWTTRAVGSATLTADAVSRRKATFEKESQN